MQSHGQSNRKVSFVAVSATSLNRSQTNAVVPAQCELRTGSRNTA